jgi:hypothetical protein
VKVASELEEGTKGASVNVVEKDLAVVVVDAVVVVVVVGKVVGEGTGRSKVVTESKDFNMLTREFCIKPCTFFRMISPRTVLISSQ